MPINKNEITKEQIEKAMQCKTADELMELAKTGGCVHGGACRLRAGRGATDESSGRRVLSGLPQGLLL